MQQDGQQPAESQLRALHCKPSGVVVNKRYLHRLELENDLYRRHLSRYEKGVADRLLREILCVKHGSEKLTDLVSEPNRNLPT